MIKKVNDKYVERSSLASAGGNPNKVFKLIYGAERRDLFKKYAQEQHRFPKKSYNGVGELDFNDINTWIKPIPFLGEGEYWDEDDFDEIIKTLQEEDESNRQSKELALKQKEQEKPETKENQKEKLEEYTEKKVPLKEGPGIEYLGIGGKYRIYKVTSPEGAQQFAVPTSVPNVKGWCITGGKGPKWQWGGSNHFNSEAGRTLNKAFYIFETENIADNWCVYILKGNGYDRNEPYLAFTPNDTDHNYYGIPKGVEDVPYMQVPELAKYADQTPRLTETKKHNDEVDGIYNFRGNTLLRILDQDVTELDIPVAYKNIAPNAFSDLHNLETIHFGNTLESIGRGAFAGCMNLKHVDLNSGNLSLGEEAFSYCIKLEKIDLRGVNVIPNKVFYNCSGLRAIDLSPNLTTIGTDAFLGCEKLTGIYLNENCQTIGNNAFFKCKNLTISTDFEERPAGWYKNIENHVRAIEYAESPEENQTTDSTMDPYIIKRIDKDFFYSEYQGYPDWTYYVDSATKFATKEKAEEKINALQSDWQDIYEIVSLEDYRNSLNDIQIKDVTPKKGEKKEDFISRFMSETEKEYPDQKQRYAVALSYWEKKNIKDSETYSLWQLFKKDDCAGWIMKMSDDPQKCLFANSNYLGFLEEDEDSMSDQMVVEEKLPIANGLLIYIGHYPTDDVYNTERMRNEKLATVEEAIEEIKRSWPQAQDTKINDDYYHGGIPRNAEEISVGLYSTGDYQKNIEPKDKTIYLVLPKKQAYFKTNQEDYYKSPLSKSHIMFYSYPQDTLEEVEKIAQDIISKCNAKLVSEDVYLALKDEDSEEKVREIFENFNKRKMNDSEMVIDTEAKDEEITPEEQEVKEIVVNFSIQELAKEALDDLKFAKDNDELEDKYNKWINKSDDLLSEDKITISQQEEFEDELWEHFKNLMQ